MFIVVNSFKVYMTDFFFICSIKSPQYTDMYSKVKISIAIFLPRVLVYQKPQIHFRWGTKSRDQKQDTGNDSDDISGLQASRKTDS